MCQCDLSSNVGLLDAMRSDIGFVCWMVLSNDSWMTESATEYCVTVTVLTLGTPFEPVTRKIQQICLDKIQ